MSQVEAIVDVTTVDRDEAVVVNGPPVVAPDTGDQEREARKGVAVLLRKCVACFKRGEKGYRQAMVECTALIREYVAARVALGDTRESAISAVEGQLNEVSSTTVKADRLLRAGMAYQLLVADAGLDDKVDLPWGHYDVAWCLLVQRVPAKGDVPESWVLLPGVEAECRAAFATVAENGVKRPGAVVAAQAVVRQHMEWAALAAKVAAEEAAKAADAARVDRAAKADAVVETMRAVATLEQNAKAIAFANEPAAAADQERINAQLKAAKEAAIAAGVEKAKAEQEAADKEKARIRAAQAAEAKAQASKREHERAADKAAGEVQKSASAQTRGPAKVGGLALSEKPALAQAELVALVAGWSNPYTLFYGLGQAANVQADDIQGLINGLADAGRIDVLQRLAGCAMKEVYVHDQLAREMADDGAWHGKTVEDARKLALARYHESRGKLVANMGAK